MSSMTPLAKRSFIEPIGLKASSLTNRSTPGGASFEILDWLIADGFQFGTSYWDQVIDFDALIRNEMIDPEDTALFHRTDSVDDAFQFVTERLAQYALTERGAIL